MKQEIKTIYWDMDGVLADFVKTFEEMAGDKIEVFDAMPNDPIGTFLDEHIPKGFFTKLDRMPEFEAMVEMMKIAQEKGIKVEILSAVTSTVEVQKYAIKDKAKWLDQHGLGHLPKNFVATSTDKKEFACPKSILIDDRKKSVRAFEEGGGIAILHKDIEMTKTKFAELVGL